MVFLGILNPIGAGSSPEETRVLLIVFILLGFTLFARLQYIIQRSKLANTSLGKVEAVGKSNTEDESSTSRIRQDSGGDVLPEVIRAERALYFAHWAALDQRTGTLLGFAGAIVALGAAFRPWEPSETPQEPGPWLDQVAVALLILGVCAALAAVVAAISVYVQFAWPAALQRQEPEKEEVLDHPIYFHDTEKLFQDYFFEERDKTRAEILETEANVTMRLSEEVDRRRRRLRMATLLLGTAVMLLGLGTLIEPFLQVVSWLLGEQ